MSGTKGIGIVLTSRDVILLRTLVTARILDCEQVKTIARFSSIRRTNRRLLKLVRAGLLRRWFVGTESGGQRALYGLSPQGAHRIGETSQRLIRWKPDSLIVSSQFLAHQQAVNAAFVEARFRPLPTGATCEQWLTFNVPLSPSVPLVPDGYFEIVQDGVRYPMFLEVDMGTETATVWMQKVELYFKLAIGGEFERLFHEKRFRVLVLFHSERRLHSIRRRIRSRTDKLFWFTTQQDVKQEGLWNAIWLRPGGGQKVRLLGGADAGSSQSFESSATA